MRIAQIAPLIESVPPALYGGTERVVSFLTEELVALGHDVTLFASGDSVTTAELHAVWPRALRLDPSIRDPWAPFALMLEHVRQRAEEFDILHFHLDYWPVSLFSRQPTPFVTTLHGRLDLPELRPTYRDLPPMNVVSISDVQRRPLPEVNYVATVHHGVPLSLLTPRRVEPSYLAFLGRISPEKQPDAAIRIAQAAGLPIRLAAKVDRVDEAYHRQVVEPLLDQEQARLIGEIDDVRKSTFLSGALALVMPIDWPEPFGLTMIEAMACGTPVIAFNRGSVPEILEDGVTGFIVDDEKEAITAVARLPTLSRQRIRSRFEARFTSRRLASDYLRIYEAIAGGRRERPRLRVAAGQ
jgi:glycosyltransferase involved in cell wall biosynthesis